jgi:DNA-binding NtrC family response regulator
VAYAVFQMATKKEGHYPATVLVVEDETALRMLVTQVLMGAGYLVIEACHSDEAIGILDFRSMDVDVMFSDVKMTGTLDGLDLALFVRIHWPWIAIILASGEALPNAVDLPPNTRFLTKPYGTRDLVAHLQEMVASL